MKPLSHSFWSSNDTGSKRRRLNSAERGHRREESEKSHENENETITETDRLMTEETEQSLSEISCDSNDSCSMEPRIMNDEEENDNVPTYSLYDDAYDLGPVYLHRWVDVQDEYQKHYEAQIIDLDISDDCEIFKIKVHYKGWTNKFDEWIDLKGADSVRVRKLHTFTSPLTDIESIGRHEMVVGKRVDIQDSMNKWYHAKIIQTNRYLIKVKYDEWPKDHFDDWINKDSYRIAKFESQTTKKKKKKTGTTGGGLTAAKLSQHKGTGTITSSGTNWHMSKKDVIVETSDSEMKCDSENDLIESSHHSHHLGHPRPHLPDGMSEKERYRHQYLSNFRPTKSNERRFRRIMARRGWRIVDMGDDGSCLFRTVSHQMYGTEDHHFLVRQKCIDYLTVERRYFASFITMDFDTYCERMRTNGVWGGNLEIQIMSELYERAIEIYAYSDRPMKTFNEDSSGSASTGSGTTGSTTSGTGTVTGTATSTTSDGGSALSRVGSEAKRKKPMRVSFHFNSHYNSIIDPATHESDALLKDRIPGEWEKMQIEKAELRSSQILNRSIRESDRIASEDAVIAQALRESRKLFEMQSGQAEFEKAIQSSLVEMQSREEADIQKAVAASLSGAMMTGGESKSSDISPEELIKIEESELNAALLQSLGATTGGIMLGTGGGGGGDKSGGLTGDKSSSAMSHDIGTSTGSSGLDPSGTGTSYVDTLSAQRNESSWPVPVRRCVEMGFSFDDSMQFFTIYENTLSSGNMTVNQVIEKMIDHLRQKQAEMASLYGVPGIQ